MSNLIAELSNEQISVIAECINVAQQLTALKGRVYGPDAHFMLSDMHFGCKTPMVRVTQLISGLSIMMTNNQDVTESVPAEEFLTDPRVVSVLQNAG